MTIVLLNAQSRNSPQISIFIGAVLRSHLFGEWCLAQRFITGQSEELMSEECSATGGAPSPQESGIT